MEIGRATKKAFIAIESNAKEDSKTDGLTCMFRAFFESSLKADLSEVLHESYNFKSVSSGFQYPLLQQANDHMRCGDGTRMHTFRNESLTVITKTDLIISKVYYLAVLVNSQLHGSLMSIFADRF